ncbi:hypothetical protein BZG36_03377 [Bifiguratus adelaidae]|uniref:Sensitive to high expression protein 9, mitochondrial n=1 Tax=Bifiguratus adelaidae TaxID=1938954 RepID=A0A261XXL8_9FUNG|nr:hypothetical protein BZG36_03377 [Bifiguratus adelaidae]
MQVWAVNTRGWEPTAVEFEGVLDRLPTEDQQRVLRKKLSSDAKLTLAGQLLIRNFFHTLGVPWDDCTLGRSETGKPFRMSAKASLYDTSFNISNHGDYVVLGARAGMQVGVDVMKVEQAVREESLDQFFSYFAEQYTPSEWALVRAVPHSEQLRLFYKIWTLKECYVKAIGLGLGFPLTRLEFSHIDQPVPQLQVDGQPAKNWTFRQYELDEHHVVAVAIHSPHDPIDPTMTIPKSFKLVRVQELLLQDPKDALQAMSKAINELTGYNHIEKVKEAVVKRSESFNASRQSLQEAKEAYHATIEARSKTQREINELLQRKHTWTAEDVTRFTELYRLEHVHTQDEKLAKDTYQSAEKQMDREYMDLTKSIMERYHEEQIWSDKIRSVSTYGTWALMILNILLFVAVQTIFEPRKRTKLTERFEELLVAKVDEEEAKFQAVLDELRKGHSTLLAQQEALLAHTRPASYNEAPHVPVVLDTRTDDIPPTDLLSVVDGTVSTADEKDRVSRGWLSTEPTTMRKRDFLLYTLESAVAGIALSTLFMYFR